MKMPPKLERWTANLRRNPFAWLQAGLLTATGLTLRLKDLGYSDLQADEVKALCNPASFESLRQFLIFLVTQRKGPVQYGVTCTVGLIDPSFSSEILIRLPFAIASLLALAVLFVIARRLFSWDAAVYGTFLVAANGVFIAFGRIAQYQSLVLLSVTAGLASLILAVQEDRWRVPGLYLAFAASAVGILAHFDAFFVLPPLAVLTLHWWHKARTEPGTHAWRHLIGASGLFALMVLPFYIEFTLHVSSYQLDYWGERFTGTRTNTLAAAMAYQPGPFVWFSLAAAVLGLTRIRWTPGWQVLLAWLIPPLVFIELIFKDSQTHAYTYFLPLLIVAGVGLEGVTSWLKPRLGRRAFNLSRGAILLVLLLYAYASYGLMIDHNPEYPWRPKTVLGQYMPGGRLPGTFGFPYNRNWRGVARWFAELPSQNKVVVCNERKDISDFYLPDQVHFNYSREIPPPQKEPSDKGVYVVLVNHPQSWAGNIWGWDQAEWSQHTAPEATFYDPQGEPALWIYFANFTQTNAWFH